MYRLILAAAALAVPALPAVAQTSIAETHVEAHGALSGRSPHKAYRPINADRGCRTTAMHSLPGGKLPVYGAHARPDPACAPATLAAADARRGQAAD